VNRLKLGLVTCGFLGCSPVAPGTVGTLGGVLIAWALATTDLYLLWVLLACVAIYLVGRSLAPWAEREAGKDPQIFVLDEVLGYLVTVAWVRGPSPLTLVVGFALFRFFDVLKPGPVRRLERIPGGDGILLDDLAAGVLGLLVLTAVRLFVGDPSMWEVQ
jgi:phosphatidylglycerophosphatase A